MELTQEEAHTWTLRAGRIARFEWGQDLARALQAAGLSESSAQPEELLIGYSPAASRGRRPAL